MPEIDERIRVTLCIPVGEKDGVPVFHIEGSYEAANDLTLPTVGIATGSALEEVASGMIKQFRESTGEWEDKFSIAEA